MCSSADWKAYWEGRFSRVELPPWVELLLCYPAIKRLVSTLGLQDCLQCGKDDAHVKGKCPVVHVIQVQGLGQLRAEV